MSTAAPESPFDIVIPTIGRESLRGLLGALAALESDALERVVIVDDREHGEPIVPPDALLGRTTVVRTNAAGPAAARNAGWRAGHAPWVVFLDDDVVPWTDWGERLESDLAGLPASVAGSQGQLFVPLPTDREPTDWERNVKSLETSSWITADMAYRRSALEAAGGFDTRFPRAYREDSDLALRLQR